MLKKRCCISIPWRASTAELACPCARCLPSSRWTTCRKSGRRSLSVTQSISDDNSGPRASDLSHQASVVNFEDKELRIMPKLFVVCVEWDLRSEGCRLPFHLPATPLQSNVNLLGFHGTEGVGSDHPAHLSFARGRSAGHTVYASGRESSRRGALSQEIEAAVWRSARAAHLRPGFLRRSRAARVGAAGFLRGAGVAAGDGSGLSAGGRAGACGRVTR